MYNVGDSNKRGWFVRFNLGNIVNEIFSGHGKSVAEKTDKHTAQHLNKPYVLLKIKEIYVYSAEYCSKDSCGKEFVMGYPKVDFGHKAAFHKLSSISRAFST